MQPLSRRVLRARGRRGRNGGKKDTKKSNHFIAFRHSHSPTAAAPLFLIKVRLNPFRKSDSVFFPQF